MASSFGFIVSDVFYSFKDSGELKSRCGSSLSSEAYFSYSMFDNYDLPFIIYMVIVALFVFGEIFINLEKLYEKSLIHKAGGFGKNTISLNVGHNRQILLAAIKWFHALINSVKHGRIFFGILI